MFEFKNLDKNKKDEEDKESLMDFLEICSFIQDYSTHIKIGVLVFMVIVLSTIKILDSFVLNLVLAVLVTRLICEILFAFTVDRQYEMAYKKLKYPLVFNNANISKEDELANVDNENPKIPGIEFNYEIKNESEDKFAITFQVDEENFKVLGVVPCLEAGPHFTKKVESEMLMASFDGLKKQYIYENECLVFNIVKLNKDAHELQIINKKDIDEALIITENLYYPYIK